MKQNTYILIFAKRKIYMKNITKLNRGGPRCLCLTQRRNCTGVISLKKRRNWLNSSLGDISYGK